MTKRELKIEKARLTMEWRKSLYDRRQRLKDQGAMEDEELEESRYRYERAKVKWQLAQLEEP